MAHGIVKWVDPDEGFGFIELDSGSDVVFYTRNMLGAQSIPLARQEVEFDLLQDNEELIADHIVQSTPRFMGLAQ